jgi:hypothetical protein
VFSLRPLIDYWFQTTNHSDPRRKQILESIQSGIAEAPELLEPCAVDAFLMDSTHRLLIGKENIVKINRVSRSPVMDLYFKIEINARKLPAGKIMAKIVLRDKIKNQSISAVQRISVQRRSKKDLDNI